MCDWNIFFQQHKEVSEKITEIFEQASGVIGGIIKPEIHIFKRLIDPEIMYNYEPIFEISGITYEGEKAKTVASLIERDLPLQSNEPVDVLYQISFILFTALEIVNEFL